MSYKAFVQGVGGITISGVTRSFLFPPPSLSTADLPAAWVQMPRSEEEPAMTIDGNGGWADAQVDLIVAVEPTGQGTSSQNFAACLDMMDALRAALVALNPTAINKVKLRWSIRQGGVNVAGNDYWAVIATIRGKV